jgi:hypothetical protein
MRIFFLALSLLFLINCSTIKTKRIFHDDRAWEHWVFRNYTDQDTILIDENVFKNLDIINFNEILKNNKNSKSFFIDYKRKNILEKDANSEIQIEILYEIKNADIKQYLGYVPHLENSFAKNMYIIFNVVNNRITSSFAAHLTSENGFRSEIQNVKYIGNNIYELTIINWEDVGKFSHISCFTITKEGFINLSIKCD